MSHKKASVYHCIQCTVVCYTLSDNGKKTEISQHMMDVIFHVIQTEYKGSTKAKTKITQTPALKEAIRQHQRIVTHLMLRSFILKDWATAMYGSGVKKPERRMQSGVTTTTSSTNRISVITHWMIMSLTRESYDTWTINTNFYPTMTSSSRQATSES